jgi:hypothetical protein
LCYIENMRCASFNVLADAYISYGDYSHVNPALLLPNARTSGLIKVIDELEAAVIGLQEVETPLLQAIDQTGNWQTFWSPKGRGMADGCLTIVQPGIDISDFDTHHYSDQSGYIAQTLHIGETVFANTHIKWAPLDTPEHAGIKQTTELLSLLESEQSVVLFADCNDRPHGPVRQLIEEAGFAHVNDGEPTVIVNQELVALDLLAVRGVTATRIAKNYRLTDMPNKDCPSDHIPVVADLEVR